MSEQAIQIELRGEEQNIIEVVLGHLAKEEEHKDPEAAEDLRSIMNSVVDGDALFPMDWHTVWFALNNKKGVDFPSQPYDENVAADSAMEKIDKAVGGISERYKED